MREIMDKSARIEELITKIDELNYHYYTLDEPLISDVEYDRLYHELVLLEQETGIVKPYSPTQRVGGEMVEKFEKHDHLSPLWSLDKSQSFQELLDWDIRVRKRVLEYNSDAEEKLPDPEYVLEYKFDGLTINLTYSEGLLTYAATRGNGITGEGILPQVKTVKNVPFKISEKSKMEVQGEGIMPLSTLIKYNETHDESLKNARNAAAGALRNLDPSLTGERGLLVYVYNIGYHEGLAFQTHMETMDFLKTQKFPVFPYCKVFSEMHELVREIERQSEERKHLDVLTDGMVIKVNDLKTRNILGYTNKFPRWAMAYKFEAEEVTTILQEVVWNVGRTAKVTPSAILEPVDIGGVSVRRATLNNFDDIRRKQLHLNDRVLIRRSNDVIPEILGSVPSDREVHEIIMPTQCPSCGSELVKNGVHLFCPNSLSCKPQLISRMVHFCSREAMNIEGLSEKTAALLLEKLSVSRLPDLYRLKIEDLMRLEGFKEKKSKKLLDALEKSKRPRLYAFIYALGIDNVGIKTARDLEEQFQSLSAIRNATEEELLAIEDIGPIVAESILEFFSDPLISQGVDELLEMGVFPEFQAAEEEENFFTGKSVVVTGTFERYSRSELEQMITDMGGKASSSVGKKTGLVLVGSSPGSKLEKAVKLGIPIVEEDELNKILDGGNVNG